VTRNSCWAPVLTNRWIHMFLYRLPLTRSAQTLKTFVDVHVSPVKSDSFSYTFGVDKKVACLQSPLTTRNVKVDRKYSKEARDSNAELVDKVYLSSCRQIVFAFSLVYRAI
jgi:hypothetical protein